MMAVSSACGEVQTEPPRPVPRRFLENVMSKRKFEKVHWCHETTATLAMDVLDSGLAIASAVAT
jgi:hypothetical protein